VANPRRRAVAIAALGALVVGGLVAGNGLVSCQAQPRAQAPATTRVVTAAEARRLAGVRLADWRAGHAGVHVTIGSGANTVHLTGWVDWRRPMVYLNSLGQHPGLADGMLQAIPGVVAVHAGRYVPDPAATAGTVVDPFPAPPVTPPPTGWAVRAIEPSSPIDTMLTLLFARSAGRADDAAQIASIGSRFVSTDEIGGVPVDVIDGAAIAPTVTAPTVAASTPSPASSPTVDASPSGLAFADRGGQVRYWVDAHSHLLRAEALANPTTPLRIDFDRADRTVPRAIELLGGAPITPKRLTAPQVTALSQMRAHDFVAGGGIVTIAMPVAADALLSAVGWVDWRNRALYVTVRNNSSSGPDATLRADVDGLTIRGSLGATDPSAADATAATGTRGAFTMPDLHATKKGFVWHSWVSREDRFGESDLDALLNELLALAAPVIDDPVAIRKVGARLRADTVNGVKVTVYEIRKPPEKGMAAGTGRLRYWVDKSGVLRRLELRTRNGAYGYVTINPTAVPALPDPVAAKPAA
jgi:hypothetical protein